MRRRDLFAGAGAAALSLPMPAIAQDMRARTLRFVPQSALAVADPILTTAGTTLDHGYSVFDTLYGAGTDGKPTPQMAEGHEASDDGLVWTIRLRDGLRFHDNEPVRGIDCAASILRWSKRDSFGQTLGAALEEVQAPDDRTVQLRLKRRFPRLLDALAFVGPIPAFMMPERLARTDPYKPVAEMIGSGPYRFVAPEFVSGSRSVYTRFDGYVPRREAPSLNAGAKVAHFERIEWVVIPDGATAAAALQSGEVDWYEFVDADLVPLLEKDSKVAVQDYDPRGFMGFLRFNALQPPFSNPALRRIVLSAIDQAEYMPLVTGGDARSWQVWRSMFPKGYPFVREIGAGAMPARKDFGQLKAELQQAGYAGERVVVLTPTDLISIGPYGEVTAELLRKMGMKVDLQVMDWGTVLQRRNSREPVDKGGWSIFHTLWKGASIANPALNSNIRGQGAAGYAGWFESAPIERLTQDWLSAGTDEEQQRLFDQVQELAFSQAPSAPLGQYVQKTAFRRTLTGVLPGPAAFPWNVRRR